MAPEDAAVNENVRKFHAAPPQPSAHGGGGNDLHGRVSALEVEFKHLATKSDIESIKAWALKGALAGVVIVATLVIAVLKLFE